PETPMRAAARSQAAARARRGTLRVCQSSLSLGDSRFARALQELRRDGERLRLEPEAREHIRAVIGVDDPLPAPCRPAIAKFEAPLPHLLALEHPYGCSQSLRGVRSQRRPYSMQATTQQIQKATT